MEFSSEFIPLKLADVPALSDRMKSEQARFVQILAVNTDAGVDLVYSFMKDDGALSNYEVKGVKKTDVVPSITGNFLAAFVFENEIHDLFGVTIEGIAIDFGGKFYQLAQSEPMTIISPAQKAARQMADFEERFAGTDPEKLARIKAAFAAKAAKAAEVEQSRESKRATRAAELENLDPEKAAKVRAALERKKKAAEAKRAVGSTNVERDAEIEAKLAQLDPERAAKVRAALDAKARQETAERAANTGKDGE